jgi:hypothetical protein
MVIRKLRATKTNAGSGRTMVPTISHLVHSCSRPREDSRCEDDAAATGPPMGGRAAVERLLGGALPAWRRGFIPAVDPQPTRR